MIERLFLDWIDAKAGRAAVGREYYLVSGATADETQTALAIAKLAESRADVALQPAVIEPVPVFGAASFYYHA